MTKYNPRNERIKRDYFRFQAEAQGKAENTMSLIRKALGRFEEYTGFKDFSTFNKEQAISFKKKLLEQKTQRTGEPISKATALSTLNALQEFFKWLALQRGYKAHLHLPDAEYFNLTDKDISIAKARRHKHPPTLEQIRKVIFTMPVETDIQRRNRALIAFAIVTGMRDSALASLRLKHVDTHVIPPLVRQEPDMVKTKFSKQILTYFFPVDADIQVVALDWVRELRELKLYGLNAPVFPRTRIAQDVNQCFAAQGLEPECWSTAGPIRQIFREAFEGAGLPYFHPHLFRTTLAQLGQQACKTPEEFKAWSQNLGHESPLTTFSSYGTLPADRQGMVMKALSGKERDEDKLDRLVRLMEDKLK